MLINSLASSDVSITPTGLYDIDFAFLWRFNTSETLWFTKGFLKSTSSIDFSYIKWPIELTTISFFSNKRYFNILKNANLILSLFR